MSRGMKQVCDAFDGTYISYIACIFVRKLWILPVSFVIYNCHLVIGMLNDYRIFDYRIKCSFSFSFVSHSILGNTALRMHAPVKAGSVQASCLFIVTLHINLPSTPSMSASPLPPHPCPPWPTHRCRLQSLQTSSLWCAMTLGPGTVAVTLGVALNKRNAAQASVSEWEGCLLYTSPSPRD